MKKITYAFLALATGVALLSLPAFAFPTFAFAFQGGDMTRTSLRQEFGASAIIKLEGALGCKMAGQNTGMPCQLTISDNRSGRTFGLVGNNEAMKLYSSGTRNVAIEGIYADDDTVSVSKVSAL